MIVTSLGLIRDTTTGKMTATKDLNRKIAQANVTYDGGNVTIFTTPNPCHIEKIIFIVGATAFDGDLTLDVGDSGDNDRLFPTAQITKTASAQSIKISSYIYTSATAVVCYVTQGTATQGSGTVYVLYTDLS